MRGDDDICPPAKAEIKDFHSRGQIPKAQIKKPWPFVTTPIPKTARFLEIGVFASARAPGLRLVGKLG